MTFDGCFQASHFPNNAETIFQWIEQKISIDYEKLNRTLKIAFIHRRKTLKNNFKKVDFDIEKFLIKNQLSLNTRPQEVSKDNYVKLSIELFR